MTEPIRQPSGAKSLQPPASPHSPDEVDDEEESKDIFEDEDEDE